MATIKEAPEGQGPTSAKKFSNYKDNINNNIQDDSVIIYRKWYECLIEQGTKGFTIAMKALFSYAYYGIPISSFGISRPLESILETFTPLIDSNRKKRLGGQRGAEHGYKGGRPPVKDETNTPQGIDIETPMGYSALTANGLSNVNDKVIDKDKDKNKNKVCVNDNITPHTDYSFFIPVFFFRNVQHPEAEARKFVDFYKPTNWRLQGGQYMDTDEKRIELAKRWVIYDNATDRYHLKDLNMWHELYDVAPYGIQQQMTSNLKFAHMGDSVIIYCSRPVYDWIQSKQDITEPIIKAWLEKRKLTLKILT